MADTPRCPKCTRPMKLIDSIPSDNNLPALEEFRCDSCNEEITREVE
jgi:transposase-like protein